MPFDQKSIQTSGNRLPGLEGGASQAQGSDTIIHQLGDTLGKSIGNDNTKANISFSRARSILAKIWVNIQKKVGLSQYVYDKVFEKSYGSILNQIHQKDSGETGQELISLIEKHKDIIKSLGIIIPTSRVDVVRKLLKDFASISDDSWMILSYKAEVIQRLHMHVDEMGLDDVALMAGITITERDNLDENKNYIEELGIPIRSYSIANISCLSTEARERLLENKTVIEELGIKISHSILHSLSQLSSCDRNNIVHNKPIIEKLGITIVDCDLMKISKVSSNDWETIFYYRALIEELLTKEPDLFPIISDLSNTKYNQSDEGKNVILGKALYRNLDYLLRLSQTDWNNLALNKNVILNLGIKVTYTNLKEFAMLSQSDLERVAINKKSLDDLGFDSDGSYPPLDLLHMHVENLVFLRDQEHKRNVNFLLESKIYASNVIEALYYAKQEAREVVCSLQSLQESIGNENYKLLKTNDLTTLPEDAKVFLFRYVQQHFGIESSHFEYIFEKKKTPLTSLGDDVHFIHNNLELIQVIHHHAPSIFEEIRKMHDIEVKKPGAVKLLVEEYSLWELSRYPNEVLLQQVADHHVQKPYGVMFYPKTDWNGAFYEDEHRILDFYHQLQGKYGLKLIEVGDENELAHHLARLDERYGENHKITFAFIGGHGTPDSIQLGADSYASGKSKNRLQNTTNKMALYAKTKKYFVHNPYIGLMSCSTGEVQGIGQNISAALGARVEGPRVPTNVDRICVVFNTDGSPEFNIIYKNDKQVYDAGSPEETIRKWVSDDEGGCIYQDVGGEDDDRGD